MAQRTALLAAVVLLLLGGAACSAGGSAEDATADQSRGGEAGAVADGVAATGSDGTSTGGGSVGSGSSADGSDVAAVDIDVELAAIAQDRRIVYRGKLDTVVEDVTAASGAARDAVAAEGGFLFGQEATETWAQLVFKVPATRFDAAFDAVGDIGEVRSRFLEADDVTEQYVDLESRRETLATSIGRLRGFLEAASSVDEISRLESELTRREAEHDVIAGKLRVLDERTELATLTVSFAVEDEELQALEDEESGPPGFGSGLSAGWDAVTVAAAAVATALGFALPFAPMAALVALLLWWWRRSTTTARTATVGHDAP